MRFRSPLNEVIGLGSAKDGVAHWWNQRLTAVALIPLGIWFVLAIAGVDLASRDAVVAWIAQPMTAILLSLTVFVLIYHSHLGVKVILEDYVEGAAKVVSLVVAAFAHAFLLAVSWFSIFKIAFGAG